MPKQKSLPTGAEHKNRRKRVGATQEQYGAVVGVTRSAVANWETGRTKPSKPLPTLKSLQEALRS